MDTSPEEPTTPVPLETYRLEVERKAVGAFLTVLQGSNRGRTFRLGETAVVGRSPQADV